MVPALLALAVLLPARAVTVGSPVADVHAGRVSVEALGGVGQSVLRAEGCEGTTGCLARWRPVTLGGRLSVTLLPGLGASAEYAWVGDQMRQARYRGSGTRLAGGAHASVGLGRGVGLGATVSWEQGATLATSDVTGPSDEAAWRQLRAAPVLSFAPEGGLATWYVGPTWRFASEHTIRFASTGVTSLLVPEPAWGAVLGGELRSLPLGPAWLGRTDRLVAGAEARWEGGLAADAYVGVAVW